MPVLINLREKKLLTAVAFLKEIAKLQLLFL